MCLKGHKKMALTRSIVWSLVSSILVEYLMARVARITPSTKHLWARPEYFCNIVMDVE